MKAKSYFNDFWVSIVTFKLQSTAVVPVGPTTVAESIL